MFGDRQASYRSYDHIEVIAEKARLLGQVTAHSQFDVISFIIGPLKLRMNGDLEICLFEADVHPVPAFVAFHKDKKISLHVSKNIWSQAKAGFAHARFVLCHEVGHILLHQHDALGYSTAINSRTAMLEDEARTEPQANLFADLLLIPTSMLNGFGCHDDIAEYFNVPLDCARRRFDYVEDLKRRRSNVYIGEACPECANFTLVRNGICLKCDTCGSTTGCS